MRGVTALDAPLAAAEFARISAIVLHPARLLSPFVVRVVLWSLNVAQSCGPRFVDKSAARVGRQPPATSQASYFPRPAVAAANDRVVMLPLRIQQSRTTLDYMTASGFTSE